MLSVTCFRFGNCPVNGLVTEQPQYSVIICIFSTSQNTEISLISNGLRLIYTYSLSLALAITFHTSRHTFGTMMMTVGADLYTTCKLMGHADVRTTQIYAKIVDSKKIEAVNMVDKMFEKMESGQE